MKLSYRKYSAVKTAWGSLDLAINPRDRKYIQTLKIMGRYVRPMEKYGNKRVQGEELLPGT